MSFCAVGPKFCQNCGKELDFGAKVCSSCDMRLEAKPLRKSSLIGALKRFPMISIALGILIMGLSYLFAFWDLDSIFIGFDPYFFSSGILFHKLPHLLVFSIGFFLVYLNLSNKSRGILQFSIGLFVLTYLLVISYWVAPLGELTLLRFFYRIGYLIPPGTILIIFGVLTLKYNSYFQAIGFFFSIHLITQSSFWIIMFI